jgi:hypothetical protein
LIPKVAPSVSFGKTQHNVSVKRNTPVGVEVIRLFVDHRSSHCSYGIHSVERVASKDLFSIDTLTGSIIVEQPLEYALDNRHYVNVVYQCSDQSQFAQTRLRIDLLDIDPSNNQSKTHYRFSESHYLAIVETSLIINDSLSLLNFRVFSNDSLRRERKTKVRIIQGTYMGRLILIRRPLML